MSRIRLTITLDQQILQQVDTLVDGKKIRNRSHAIEYALKKQFSPQVSKALILAGGEVDKKHNLPKPMINIGGVSALELTIKKLYSAGIQEVLLVLGDMGDKIKEHFGDGEKFGINIKYIEQKKPGQGTALAIYEARHYFSNEPFLIWYGDVLADIDILHFIRFHVKRKRLVSMALTSVQEPSGWGVVKLRGSEVVDLQEKPGETSSFVINAGIYIASPKIFNKIEKNMKSFEREVLVDLAKEEKLGGYLFDGDWVDVGV